MKSLYAVLIAIALSYSMAPVVRAQNQQLSPESRRRVVHKVPLHSGNTLQARNRRRVWNCTSRPNSLRRLGATVPGCRYFPNTSLAIVASCMFDVPS
jgi:hypothetical protein